MAFYFDAKNRLFLQIRQARLELGFTQSRLAQEAKISLATLQNIEGGKANPELETICNLCAILGLELSLLPSEVNWSFLQALGLPLMEAVTSHILPTRQVLIKQLLILNRSLSLLNKESKKSRALKAFLWALRDHFPSVWIELSPQLDRWLKDVKFQGADIKLKRIALAQLAGYL